MLRLKASKRLHSAGTSSKRGPSFLGSSLQIAGFRQTERLWPPSGRAPSVLNSTPASRDAITSSLISALTEQFQRDSLPWIRDLVEPLLEGTPGPLTGTTDPRQLADPDSRFITVNGIRMHYKERVGPGAAEWFARRQLQQQPELQQRGGTQLQGQHEQQQQQQGPGVAPPTLVLMHGINGSEFSWRLLMDDLAADVSPSTGGCRVVAYDRPPYGLSQRPLGGWKSDGENPYTLQGAAWLTAGLLDALECCGEDRAAVRQGRLGSGQDSSSSSSGATNSRAVLVGHSAGASVAVETALRYPDKVAALVLIAPAISTEPSGFLARADLGQLLRFAWTRALIATDGPGLNYVRRQVLKRGAEVRQGRLGIYHDEQERGVPQEVIDGYLRPLLANDWDRGTLMTYRSLQLGGSPPALDQLRVPVLIVTGRQDNTVPLAAVQKVATVLRRRAGCVTQMVVLERCGHGPMDEHPDQVLAAMTTFLNTHCFPTITTPKAATANSSSSRATAMPNQVSRGSGSVASPVPSAGHVGHGR